MFGDEHTWTRVLVTKIFYRFYLSLRWTKSMTSNSYQELLSRKKPQPSDDKVNSKLQLQPLRWVLTALTSTRYTLAYMLFTGIFLVYAQRVNFNIALVAMTTDGSPQNQTENSDQCRWTQHVESLNRHSGKSCRNIFMKILTEIYYRSSNLGHFRLNILNEFLTKVIEIWI